MPDRNGRQERKTGTEDRNAGHNGGPDYLPFRGGCITFAENPEKS